MRNEFRISGCCASFFSFRRASTLFRTVWAIFVIFRSFSALRWTYWMLKRTRGREACLCGVRRVGSNSELTVFGWKPAVHLLPGTVPYSLSTFNCLNFWTTERQTLWCGGRKMRRIRDKGRVAASRWACADMASALVVGFSFSEGFFASFFGLKKWRPVWQD